jgi:hypothetical protein
MNKFAVTCSILLLLTLTAQAQEHSAEGPRTKTTPPPAAAGWVRRDPEAGRFSILLPESVEEKNETGSVGNFPYTTHLLMGKTDKALFIVGWVDYDPDFNFSVQSELEANRDKFVAGVKGTLLGTTKIVLNGYPGIEFTAETDQVFFKSRVYIVGRRPYQLIAGIYKGQDESTNVARFFDSFQVKPR